MASKTSSTENRRHKRKTKSGHKRKAKESRRSTKSQKELFGD